MEMVKENNEEKMVMKAGMSIIDEFNLWFNENRTNIRDRAYSTESGDDDTYYVFAQFISNFCLDEFCSEKGLDRKDIEDGFTYPVIAADLFID